MMTPEQNKDYDDYCEMFSTAGWKAFVSSVTDKRENTLKAAPTGAATNDQWQFCRGMLDDMDTIIGFENYIHEVWKQMVEWEKEDNSDE
jgi:hypothetical protein